ncbi:MAG TPA: hypothetical protein VFB62_07870, partial [Polyangiaceae bacterium]|nr:hypothetical protein [Polyangiaceae bacterium]
DKALVEIERFQNERSVREGDIAMVLRRAADTCRRDGDSGRARQALTLARSQWLLLGNEAEATRAAAEIASIGEE